MHKLHDRVGDTSDNRLDDKDAADVIRLMQATSAEEVGRTLARLCRHEIAGQVSRTALAYMDELFGRRGRVGIQMAARALRLGMPEERVEALAAGYTGALLASASPRPR